MFVANLSFTNPAQIAVTAGFSFPVLGHQSLTARVLVPVLASCLLWLLVLVPYNGEGAPPGVLIILL